MSSPLVPPELRSVPRHILEVRKLCGAWNECREIHCISFDAQGYVNDRIRQYSGIFAAQLLGPDAAAQGVERAEVAMSNTLRIMSAQSIQAPTNESYILRFTHSCKFIGCRVKDCILCANNPNKRCTADENFQEAYADNQVLRSKCDSDIHIEIVSTQTGLPADIQGAEIQICVIDGESCDSRNIQNARELRASDDGSVLIGWQSTDGRGDGMGRLLLRTPPSGIVRLPDVVVRDKNDTFHIENHTFSTFRLKAIVIRYDPYTGVGSILPNVTPTVSEKFVIKTQRAMNDYSKNEFPNFRDELTKLKFIGTITAQRLKDIQSYVQDVPFTSIETVEQLKHLMQYSDQNRQVENKLLELLNMRGKHKYKWDFLREVLQDKIVYDDTMTRAWFADEALTQGLVFTCKQGQINLERPFGVAQRVSNGSSSHLQVMPTGEIQNLEMLRSWRTQAEKSWSRPQHSGWVVVQEAIELVNASGAPITSPRTSLADGLQGLQGLEALGEVYKRESMSMGVNQGFRAPTEPLNTLRTASHASVVSPTGLGLRGEGSGHGLPHAFSGPSASQIFQQQQGLGLGLGQGQGSFGHGFSSPGVGASAIFTGASSMPMGGFGLGAMGDPNAPHRSSGGKSKAGSRGRRASVDALNQRRLSQGSGFQGQVGSMGSIGSMGMGLGGGGGGGGGGGLQGGHSQHFGLGGLEPSSKSDTTMKRPVDMSWSQADGLEGRPNSRSRVTIDPYHLQGDPPQILQGMGQPSLSPFGGRGLQGPSRFASNVNSVPPSPSTAGPQHHQHQQFQHQQFQEQHQQQMTPEDIDRFLESSLGNIGQNNNMNFDPMGVASRGESGVNSGSLPLMDRDSDMFKNKVSLNENGEDLVHSAAAAAAAAVAAIDAMGSDEEMFVPMGERVLSKQASDSFNRFIKNTLLSNDTGSFK